MNCINCGAALPALTDVCNYCAARNDTDLRRFDVKPGEDSQRICPRCDKKMGTVNIALGRGTNIERCDGCFGLFFDRHELHELIAGAITKTYEVDYQRLSVLAEQRKVREFPVGYVKCPVCREIMNRRAFGPQSGVVVDTCKEHGIWLDQGELGTLLRWAQVGGLILSSGQADLGWEAASSAAAESAGATGSVADSPHAATPSGAIADGGTATDNRSATQRRRPVDALGALTPGESQGQKLVRTAKEAVEDSLRFLGRLLGSTLDTW